tara:strand:+ start:5058 stop:6278 length:1221 start_codon:yes stop_codon:yes gene_type:complete
MKNIYYIFTLCLAINSFSYAQTQSVILNGGYTNQSFYNFSNGEVSNISNINWDIAFSTDAFSTTIRINDGKGVELYNYTLGDTSDWNLINNSTTNIITNSLNNSDTSWEIGAFNLYNGGGFDYSWGVYNLVTHHINGDSLYIIKTINGNWKKLWIKSKISGDYLIQYSNLDGSNLVSSFIDASNYDTKRFIYFSMDQNLILDREPTLDSWDITFTKYITDLGIPYSVTGVLGNVGIKVAKVTNLVEPYNFTDYNNQQYNTEINSIGYDWKTFSGGGYTIDNNRCYFVKDYQQNVWRLIFSNFNMSNGKIDFNTQLMTNVSINENYRDIFEIYPNPANDILTVIYELKNNSSIIIHDMYGRVVYEGLIESGDFYQKEISVSHFKSGVYFLKLVDLNNEYVTKKLIIE